MKNSCYTILFILCLVETQLPATTPIGGVAGSLTVTNTIIYNDLTYSQFDPANITNITYTAVRGSAITGIGNLTISSFSALKDSIAVAPVDTFSYYLSPTSALRNAGINSVTFTTASTDINGNTRTFDGTIDIGAVEYSEVYKGASATWETASDWNIGRIPHNKDIVSTRTACQVTSTTITAVCKKLIIESGSLTIKPNTQLIVSDSIRNKDATKLIVKAATDNTTPNGTLIFHNTSVNPPSATVEMYSKASWNKSLGTNSSYNWQYFGVPVLSVTASTTFDGAFVRKWDETGTSISNHWIQQNNASVLTPFTGYEICQSGPATYTIQGQLVNSPFISGPLTISYYTSNSPKNALFPGQYIFANPYTAAIDIRQLKSGSGAQQTVYMYNTGSYTAWNSINGSISNDSTLYAAGQYIAVPFYTAGNSKLPRQIPSMQAFLIRPNDITIATNYNFSFDYSSVVMKNIALQRAPNTTDASSSEMVCTKIDVTGKNANDRMWLFSQPGCTRNFDNGWDGAKIPGAAVTPQIFAIEPDNNYQVDAVEDINNTVLGFQAGQDKDYTLTFTHQNLADKYSGVFLVDLVENKTIDITASGSTYSFTAESSPTPVKRFIIATRDIENETAIGNTQLKVLVTGNIVLVQNSGNQNGELSIFDIMGHFIKKTFFGSYGVTAVQIGSISGVYIATAIAGNEKVSTKVIIDK